MPVLLPHAKAPMTKTRRKPGPKPTGKRREAVLTVKLSDEELDRIKAAAKSEKDGPYRWARRMLLLAADARLSDDRLLGRTTGK